MVWIFININAMKTLLRILLTLIPLAFCSQINAQEIFHAIRNGENEKVEQLISIDPKLVDTMIVWNTPLLMASYFGKEKIVELLLNRGADMYKFKHENGMVGLHYASMQNHTSVVDVLIKKGVDVNFKDGGNKTALIYAIENNRVEMTELLLNNQAKLPEEKEMMAQVLHSAVLYGFQDISEKLMANGASLTSIDIKGLSLLHNAIIGHNTKWIDLLMTEESNLNILDNFNRTPLHYSVELNQLELAKLLVQKGVDVNIIDCTNRTPLNIANDLGYIEIADFLESKGGVLSEPKVIKIAGEGPEKSEIKVTFITNVGVLISSASKTILIDALFNNMYHPIPEKIISKLNNLEYPFNSIDLLLITHDHSDHFSAPMVAEYLSINKTAKVVCSSITSSTLKKAEGYKVDTTRIVTITPELYHSIDTVVNNINIKTLRLRHNGGDGSEEHIGFVIDMDGVNVFHSGDSDGYVAAGQIVSGIQEYDSIGIEEMKIDLAILNKISLWNVNAPGSEIIQNYIKPKHIILTHFSGYDKEGEWDRIDQTIKEKEAVLPEITVFKWPMQEIILQKGF